MRARHPLRSAADPFVKTVGVEQQRAGARAPNTPQSCTRGLRGSRMNGHSISAAAWSSRRLTTAGVAPMSLIETRTPASGWRCVEVA